MPRVHTLTPPVLETQPCAKQQTYNTIWPRNGGDENNPSPSRLWTKLGHKWKGPSNTSNEKSPTWKLINSRRGFAGLMNSPVVGLGHVPTHWRLNMNRARGCPQVMNTRLLLSRSKLPTPPAQTIADGGPHHTSGRYRRERSEMKPIQ